jgi:hypothetical protein
MLKLIGRCSSRAYKFSRSPGNLPGVTEVHCSLDSLNLMSQISMYPKPSERHREPHRAAVVAGLNVNRRRSSRIALTAAIELSG